MAEKKSIGYIPPTPFRDDSDVFVLPAASEVDLEDGEDQQAWLAEELEVMRAQRTSIRQRNSEIVGAFQLVLRQLSEQTGTAQRASKTPVPQNTDQAPAKGDAQNPLPLPADRGDQTVPSESAETGSGDGADRLAMLKAQLASRIKSFQTVSGERQESSQSRGDE